MPQTQRQEALLNACHDFLVLTKEPIHYKQLTTMLVDSGMWAEPYGKEPDQILYSALHNDVKRHGVRSRFLFLGGGVFCTSEIGEAVLYVETPNIRANAAPRDPFYRAGDMPRDTEARRQAAAEERRCGNCASLTWDGPQVLLQEVGGCSRYEHTQRACVYKCSEACGLWQPRTVAQRDRDRLDRIADVLTVKRANKGRFPKNARERGEAR